MDKNLEKTNSIDSLEAVKDIKVNQNFTLENFATDLTKENNFNPKNSLDLTKKIATDEQNFDLGNLSLETNQPAPTLHNNKDKNFNKVNSTSNFDLGNFTLEPLPDKTTQVLSAEKNSEKIEENKNNNSEILDFDTSTISNDLAQPKNLSIASEVNKNNSGISSLDIFEANVSILPDTVVQPKIEDNYTDPFASFNDSNSTIVQNQTQDQMSTDPFDLFGQVQTTSIPETMIKTDTQAAKDPFDLFG